MKFSRFVICFGLLLSACISNAVDLGTLFGKWAIDDVYCRTCPSVDKSDIGTTVTLLSDRASNPLAGGACPGITAYRKIPDTPELRAAILQKLDPKWIVTKKIPELLAVTCDKMDFMLFVVLSDGTLVYIDDGNIVYRLLRQ